MNIHSNALSLALDSNSTMLPCLRHCTLIEQASTNVLRMVVGAEHFDISPLDDCGKLLRRSKRYFDGCHSVREASERLDVPEADIRALAGQFAALKLFRP